MGYKKNNRSHSSRGSGKPLDRIMVLRGIMILLTAIIFFRLVDLQVVHYAEFKGAADGEHKFFKKLFPQRGEIFTHDRGMDRHVSPALVDVSGQKVFPAVINREYGLLYAVPTQIQDAQKVAEQLAPIIGAEKDTLLAKFSKKNDLYEELAKKVDDEHVAAITALQIPGLYFRQETYRFYPEKDLGGHVFGYVGNTGATVRGLYGLEGYYDQILKGKEGSLKTETDAVGALIPVGEQHLTQAVDGNSLVLTLDRTVQLITCDRLKAWVLQHGADGGSAIIMDPQTGAIIAMCSTPDFEPFNYQKFDIKTYSNPAIFTPYEPGSIFKPITMAMGIDMNKVNPNTTYQDTGKVTIGPYTIKNSDGKSNGKQTMIEVLDKSLNTGAIFVARKVGIENFRNYMKAFGFGALTGIELDKEVPGNITALKDSNEIYMATSAFGQGITVTPLQMVSAYAALANGGTLMQPYIVDSIVKPDGTVTKTKPKALRRVVSERTSALLGGMLVSVVRKGHGKRAGVEGYYVAGKTGTAQVPRKEGRGYETNDTIGSFAGFAPVDKPKFTMLVKIDHPRDVQWAESSAAPLFGEIAKFLLDYYEVPPDDKRPASTPAKPHR